MRAFIPSIQCCWTTRRSRALSRETLSSSNDTMRFIAPSFFSILTPMARASWLASSNSRVSFSVASLVRTCVLVFFPVLVRGLVFFGNYIPK